MKNNIYNSLFLLFVSCFVLILLSGCFFLWSDSGIKSKPLYGTPEILLIPEQERYTLNDELKLDINYSCDEKKYDKLLLKCYVSKYDPTVKKYVCSDDFISYRENSEINLINGKYEFTAYNESFNSIEESFLLKAKTAGTYQLDICIVGCRSDLEYADYYSEIFYIEFVN